MHYPEAEQSTRPEATLPVVFPPAPVSLSAEAEVPVWPPPPRPRPPQGISRRVRVLSVILAVLLVAGGMALLIYSTTSQYGHALNTQNGRDATSTAQGVLHALATRARQQTATAGPLGTADAHIYATATAQAGPSATASAASAQGTSTAQAMLAALTNVTNGTPALNDPLSDNSLGNTWDTGYTDNNNTGCNFVDSSYQVLEALPGFLRPCFADATNFGNLAYQVTMTLNSDCGGGLILRGNKDAGKYYLFTVNASGFYQLEVYNGNNHIILANGNNAAILGVGQANTLVIMAKKGVFDLFVNQTFLAEVADGQLSAGQVGVAVYNTAQPASADFSDAKVWKI